MKPQVLFIGELNKSLDEYKAFSEKFECIDYTITSIDQLIEDFKTKFANVVAIYGAWLGFMLVGGFRDKILENAPASLKAICICSVGYDGYDGQGMKDKGIILTNVPATGAAGPVADLVLYNVLEAFRSFRGFERNFIETNHSVLARYNLDGKSQFDSRIGKMKPFQNGKGYAFGEHFGSRQILSPSGHKAVIIGFGNIGQMIGSRLAGIGMNITYVKRSKLSTTEEAKLGYAVNYAASIKDAIDSDLVVIACPATTETYHLINKDVIDSFTKPFRLVNVGRGTVIDEQALVDGLKSGKVLFAGLDVYENEPECHPDLLGREDVILTPHIGASTVENFDHTAIVAMQNIENIIGGGNGINRVN